ncbi:DUF502 domain-containing protein [Roseateles sp.]|uniref:DUF502 domain-containing protein n=1 Tax=Roseateles sp. TaxID=1971397 RepID=UPI003919BB4F
MKKYIITGLLVWLPLAITVWVLLWVLGLITSVFEALLSALQAVAPLSLHNNLEALRHVPGLGVLILVAALLLTGVFVANIFGQWWLRQWDRLLSNIPIVKSIYNSVKQVSDTLFSSSGNAFREAVLVQYPREGCWTIAFVTGRPGGEVAEALPGEHVSLYVPTTPNPTSGFFLMMPRASIKPLAMSVDEALKHIISMGVVAPSTPPDPARNPKGSADPKGRSNQPG